MIKFTDKVREVKEISMMHLLQSHRVHVNKRNQALCVFHDEDNPSMAVYPSKVKCFHSGEVEDTIAVYMALNGLGQDQFKQAVNEMYDLFIGGGSLAPNLKPKAREISPADKTKKHKSKTLEKAKADFIPFDLLDLYDQERIKEYFRQRGIEHAVEDLKACGYDVGLDRSFKQEGHYFNLMYRLNGFYIKRGLYNDFKGNAGTSQVTKLHKYKSNPYWVVVEGITDALSILEMQRQGMEQYNVMSLNSASNVTKLIKNIGSGAEKTKKDGYTFLLLLDRDTAGREAEGKAISFLTAQGINNSRLPILDKTPYNDINELLACRKRQALQERYRAVGIEC